MRQFDIWSEGYRVTGNEAGPMRLGTARGETFKDACHQLALDDAEFKRYFDPERMT